MEPGFIIFGVVSTTIILIYFITKIHHLYLSQDKIEDFIVKYYEKKGIFVNDISDLNFTERIKYGVPVISIFRIYSYYFGFLSGKVEYVRKVDAIDKKDNEHTKYVEITVQGKDIISLREFATYDI